MNIKEEIKSILIPPKGDYVEYAWWRIFHQRNAVFVMFCAAVYAIARWY